MEAILQDDVVDEPPGQSPPEVDIPKKPSPLPDRSKSTALSSQDREAPTPKPAERDTGKPKFLLVDDNIINLNILGHYMKKLHYKYETAMDGQRAVDMFKEGAGMYKCVFMDISMPVMSGFESSRLIRAYEAEHDLPGCHIIALTGLASASAQQEAFASGIDLFLTKPVKLKELSKILASKGLAYERRRSV